MSRISYAALFLYKGILTDRLVYNELITFTNARKLFNSLTSFVPVLCMVSLCFCNESRQVLGIITVLVFLAISGYLLVAPIMLIAFVYSGYFLGLGYGSGYVVNFADVVPAYSGLVFGLANTLSSLAGLIGNIVAGMVVSESVLEQYRKLFIMFGVVYFIGGLVYLLFGSAVPREWAKFQAVASEPEKSLNTEETIPMNTPSINTADEA